MVHVCLQLLGQRCAVIAFGALRFKRRQVIILMVEKWKSFRFGESSIELQLKKLTKAVKTLKNLSCFVLSSVSAYFRLTCKIHFHFYNEQLTL